MRIFFYIIFGFFLNYSLQKDDHSFREQQVEKYSVRTVDRALDVIFVLPPTGERETDRINIQNAFDAVQPGGTVQFSPGTYLLGAGARLTVPDVTILGHPEGTIIRGCEPEAFSVNESELASVVFGCTGFYIQTERQTIRGLTFEYIWHAIVAGPYPTTVEEAARIAEIEESPPVYSVGGQIIEGNTFRSVANGLRMLGTGKELSVVRDNDFIDVFHAIGIYGAPLHFLNNRITVNEPESVPYSRHPGSAVLVAPDHTDCTGHVIKGNLIDGYPDPIYVITGRGQTCHGVKIIDNTIRAARVKIPEAWAYIPTAEDSTMVGTPITLMNLTEPFPGMPEADTEGVLKDILVRGNKILGGEGLGILIHKASRSRIEENMISGIQRRDPFPGITWDGFEQNWEDANGSGIWISQGSDGNEIINNNFKNIASAAVFIEGNNDRVEVLSGSDSIRDMGTGNFVDQIAQIPDTTRFTIIINGQHQSERRMWQSGPNTWHFRHEGDAFHFPRTERLVLDTEGYPLEMEIEGQRLIWDRWTERYERKDGMARWSAKITESVLGPDWTRILDEGDEMVSSPIYYAAVHPVHDLGFLARLLLNRDDNTLDLLPEGQARLEPVEEKWVEIEDKRRRIRLFAIHGLDLRPLYVWLDDDDTTFADEWSVLAGWEDVFPKLRAASEKALADHHRDLAHNLVPPARERPLVVRGARLFNPDSGAVEYGTTIIIEGNRISSVGPDNTLDLPPNSEILDAAGKMVLPGLWDMHAHHGFPGPYFELKAPLYLAGGITMARDMGTPVEPMLSLRQRIQTGEAVGPRLLLAGWIGGAGGRPTGTLVANAAEANAVVERYVDLGYDQIKIYGDLSPDLVPVVIKRAKEHNLRVSGEVVRGMTAREAVASGYEEINHIDALFYGLISSEMKELIAQRTPDRLVAVNKALAELTPDSKSMQELIQLLASESVAVDPTLVVFAAQGMESPPWVKRVSNRFPPQAQRRMLDQHLFGHWPLSPFWDEILGNMVSLVGTLHEAGVPVLPGSDTEMAGFDLHHELGLYVEAGIPAPQVLTLATLGAAQVMNMEDELGSIEPGKMADLILIDGDPTKNISDIRRVITVIKDGRVYDPAAIYRALGIEPCCEE